MNVRTGRLLKLILASAIAAPIALFAAEQGDASHHPAQMPRGETAAKTAQSTPNEIMERMQIRMRAMQQVSDPQARMSMMMAQMQDMQDIQGMMMGMNSGCPMAGGNQGMGGQGMMGGGSGGMMGGGMQGHMGSGNAKGMPGSPAK